MFTFATGAVVARKVSAGETAAKGLRIYISADMEGVAGVVTREQLHPHGFEYQRFRTFFTSEVNAAIDAAFKAGAGEIVVSDSHGNKQNLLIEKFPKTVRLIRGGPRALGMVHGIGETDFDGLIFIGYHVGGTSTRGVRAHTFSSRKIASIRLNGTEMSEAGFNAALAGHFNIPVIMISGDDAVVQQTRTLLGDVEGAVVKWSYGLHAARSMTPEAAQNKIHAKVTAAIKRIKDFKPYRMASPVLLEIRFVNYQPAELLEMLPYVKRVNSHTIRLEGETMVEVSNFIKFVLSYSSELGS